MCGFRFSAEDVKYESLTTTRGLNILYSGHKHDIKFEMERERIWERTRNCDPFQFCAQWFPHTRCVRFASINGNRILLLLTMSTSITFPTNSHTLILKTQDKFENFTNIEKSRWITKSQETEKGKNTNPRYYPTDSNVCQKE